MQPAKPKLKFRIIQSGLMSMGMSALVVLVATILNMGISPKLGSQWLQAWSLAFPVAWFAAFVWGPIATRLSHRLTGTKSD